MTLYDTDNPMKFIDVDALAEDRQIRVNAEEHAVKMISGAGMMVAQSMFVETDPAVRIEKLCRIVGMVVPTLTKEQVEDLTLDQLKAIFDLSLSSVNELRENLPNEAGPVESASPA